MGQFQDLHKHSRQASVILKAIGNERRLRILCHLANGEHSVSELDALIGLSQSALSQHLARLRQDGLVTTRRSAQTVYYDLNGEMASTIMEAVESLLPTDDSDDDRVDAKPVSALSSYASPSDAPVAE